MLCRLCRHLYPPGLDEAVCPQIGGEEDPTTPTIRPSNCVVTRSVSEPSRDGTHSRARGRQAHGQSPTQVGRFSRRGQCRVVCSCICCLLAGRRVAADARSAWTERLGECCRAAVWAGIGSEDNTTQHTHDKHMGKTARHDSKSNRLTPLLCVLYTHR